MIFVVNTELGMGVGKIAAQVSIQTKTRKILIILNLNLNLQVAHATLGIYRVLTSPGRSKEEKVCLTHWEEFDGYLTCFSQNNS